MRSTLLWFSYFLLLIPKINLIAVGDFNAGLRVDDLLLVLIFILLVANVVKRGFGSVVFEVIEKRFILFICVYFFSVVWNLVFFSRSSILFPIRFVEYFIFFYIGFKLYGGKRDVLRNLLLILFFSNIVVVFFQYFGVLGGFSVTGYRSDVSDRVIGLTGGPWELGVVLNLITCYFMSGNNSKSIKISIFLISTVVILMNGSRMSLVAQVAVAIAFAWYSGNLKKSIFSFLILIPFLYLLSLFYVGSGVATRSEDLTNIQNISLMAQEFNNINASEKIVSWSELGIVSAEGEVDASWGMRIPKWIYSLKMWTLNFGNILWGVGPGSFGNALDGGWLRILTESGILGLCLFSAFLYRMSKINLALRLCVIAVSINMFFIDIYMSYKIMSLLFLMCGYFVGKNKFIDKLNISKLNTI